jgi:uncharacterized membrane protein
MWMWFLPLFGVAILLALFLTEYLPTQWVEARSLPEKANRVERLLFELEHTIAQSRSAVVAAEWSNNVLWFSEVAVGAVLASNLAVDFTPSRFVLALLGAGVLISGLVRKNYRPEEKLQGVKRRTLDLQNLYRHLATDYAAVLDPEVLDARRLAQIAEEAEAAFTRIEEQYAAFDMEPVRFRSAELSRLRESRHGNDAKVALVPMPIVGGGPDQ